MIFFTDTCYERNFIAHCSVLEEAQVVNVEDKENRIQAFFTKVGTEKLFSVNCRLLNKTGAK